MQRDLALVDTGADCSLICGNPEKFLRPAAYINGYEGAIIKTKAVTSPLGIGCLPPCLYKFYVSPVPEYILRVDVSRRLSLQASPGKFHL